jgi:hypothetical protein
VRSLKAMISRVTGFGAIRNVIAIGLSAARAVGCQSSDKDPGPGAIQAAKALRLFTFVGLIIQ